MGLFFNYDKPGPGVSKDAPKKKRVISLRRAVFQEVLASYKSKYALLCGKPTRNGYIQLYYYQYISGCFAC